MGEKRRCQGGSHRSGICLGSCVVHECPNNDRLLRMLEQALNDAEQTEVAHHVDACERCQNTLDGLTAEGVFLGRQERQATVAGPRPPASGPNNARFGFLSPPQEAGEIGRLADYRILELLGEGGMGMVFRAEDTQLRRAVALKVMHGQIAGDTAARARFLREARATAALKNEHIVTIHQVGEANGVPYLVMELLEGESLERRLEREGKLPFADVLRIGRQAAEGLAAAHARGLVHRDVKPANLWLEAPHGRVKLLDFGLVWAAQETALTQSGFAVGTPSFMPPEQARSDSVDPRGDLFSLGCVLYRLVAGEPPFRGPTAMATLLAIANDTPRTLRERDPSVPAALNDLVLRLLAKRPEDRPPSAQETAQALAVLESGSGTVAVRAGRSADCRTPPKRRGREAAVLVLLGLGLILSFWPRGREAPLPTKNAGEQKPAPPPLAMGPFGRLRASDIDPEQRAIAGAGDPQKAPAELVAVLGDGRMHLGQSVRDLGFSADGKMLGASSVDGTIMLWDLATGRGRCFQNGIGPGRVVFDPQRQRVFWANDAGPWKCWAVATGEALPVLPGMEGQTTPLRLSADGRWLAAGRGDSVQLWDLKAGKLQHTLAGHRRSASSLAFDPASKRLAVAQADHSVKVWDLTDGAAVAQVPAHPADVSALAFSPDGKTLATGTAAAGITNQVRFWDASNGKPQGTLNGVFQPIHWVCFSADGKTVIVPADRTTLWGRISGNPVAPVLGRGSVVHALGVSADGGTLALGDLYGKISLIDVNARRERPAPFGSVPPTLFFDVRRDDGLVATFNQLGGIRVWDGATGQLVRELQAASSFDPEGVSFQPNGPLLAVAVGNTIWLHDTRPDKPALELVPPGNRPWSFAFRPDGKALVALVGSESLALWDELQPGRAPRLLKLSGPWVGARVVFHPDGQRVAVVVRKTTPSGPVVEVEVIEMASGKTVQSFGASPTAGVAFSPDGTRLAASDTRGVLVWDVAGGALVERLTQEPAPNSIAFRPDGQQLAASGPDGKMHLWNLGTPAGAPPRHRIMTLTPLPRRSRIVYSADGRHLVVFNGNNTVYVLRLGPPE